MYCCSNDRHLSQQVKRREVCYLIIWILAAGKGTGRDNRFADLPAIRSLRALDICALSNTYALLLFGLLASECASFFLLNPDCYAWWSYVRVISLYVKNVVSAFFSY